MFRKLLPFLFGALIMVTGSSCFDILETIRLNKDGSGTYTLDMDLGEALEMIMQFSSSMDSSFGGDPAMAEAFTSGWDTTFLFADAPDSIRTKWVHPEVIGKGQIELRISPDAEGMVMSFSLPFSSPLDIDRFGTDLGQTGDLGIMDAFSGGGAPAESGGPLMMTAPNQFGFSSGKLTRAGIDGASMFGASEEEGGEDMAMLKMFLAGASYTVRYELPGKVKKVVGEGYEQPDKKTVVMERDLGDLLDNKTNLAIEIRY